jgi:hypothetical protein
MRPFKPLAIGQRHGPGLSRGRNSNLAPDAARHSARLMPFQDSIPELGFAAPKIKMASDIARGLAWQ